MKQSIKKFLCRFLIPCMMILCFLPLSSSFASGRNMYVCTQNGKSLNVRKRPEKKGPVICRLANGSQVSVLNEEGDWLEIELDGKTGYVMAEFVVSSKPKSPEIEWTKTKKTMYVKTGNKNRLNLRKDATRKSKSLGLYANGTEIKVTALSSGWAKVTVNGQEGYMMLSCLTEEEPEIVIQEEETATEEKPLTRYVKGGGSLKMYAEAGSDSELLMKLPAGTMVRVYSTGGKWAKVTAHGQVGFVVASYLTDQNPCRSKGKATIINPNGASYVNLRSNALMSGTQNVLAHIRVNSRVDIYGKKRSWMLIGVDGKVGYVHGTFVEFE